MKAYLRFRCLVVLLVCGLTLSFVKMAVAGPNEGLAYGVVASILVSVIMAPWLTNAPDFAEWQEHKSWRKTEEE